MQKEKVDLIKLYIDSAVTVEDQKELSLPIDSQFSGKIKSRTEKKLELER